MSAKATVKTTHTQVNGGLPGLGKRYSQASLAGMRVKIGLPKGAADYPDGTSVIMVGAVNEFGSDDGDIPERSFLRSAMRRFKRQHNALIVKLAKAVTSGNQSPEIALGQLGTVAASHVQDQIRDTTSPPNAPSTIKAKGSSHPLIDTGHLIQSITWQRIKGKK